MEAYLAPMRRVALLLLDGGRPLDGGIFRLIGEHSVLQRLLTNGTVHRDLFVADMQRAMLSHAPLAIVIVTCIVATCLLTCMAVGTCGHRARSGSARRQRRRVRDLHQRIPRLGLLALRCTCLSCMALALVSLALALATNVMQYAESRSRSGESPSGGLGRSVQLLDSFLEALASSARVESQPVVRRALQMTEEVRTRSQAANRKAFEDHTGASDMARSSDQLLASVKLFYEAGIRLRQVMPPTEVAVRNFGETSRLQFSSVVCLNASRSSALCDRHQAAVEEANRLVEQALSGWTQPIGPNRLSLKVAMMEADEQLKRIVAALDGRNSTPERLIAERERKMNLSHALTFRLTQAFDRDLNSTRFVLDGFEARLTELEARVADARLALRSAAAALEAPYRRLLAGFESIRFGVTTAALVPSVVVALVLAAGFAAAVAVPRWSVDLTCRLRPWLVAGHLAGTVCLLLALAIFCLANYVHSQSCRYLDVGGAPGNASADAYLVPEVNAVLGRLRGRRLPVTAIGRLVGGVRDGCGVDHTLLTALDAVRFIDTSASEASAAEAQRFKENGTGILRREMGRMNLTSLYDKTLVGKMSNMILLSSLTNSCDFASVAEGLQKWAKPLRLAMAQLSQVHTEESRIMNALGPGSHRDLSASNLHSANLRMASLKLLLLNVSAADAPLMLRLERRKDIAEMATRVMRAVRRFNKFVLNGSLWTETAVRYYTKHVVNDTAADSLRIARTSAVDFLSSIGRCRRIFEAYNTVVGVPCRGLLYPLSLLWLCLAWHLCCAVPLLCCASLASACVSDTEQLFEEEPEKQDLHLTSFGARG